MSSKTVELAAAIVDLLNREPEGDEEEFVLQFDAQRQHAPLTAFELVELDEVRVSVFTGSTKSERVERKRFSKSLKPIVAVQRGLNLETPEANVAMVDKLQELVEQIEARIASESQLAEMSFEGFEEDQDREPYSPEVMSTLNAFVSAIQLEYISG